MFRRPPSGGLLSFEVRWAEQLRSARAYSDAGPNCALFARGLPVALGGAALCLDALLLRWGRGACCFLDEALGIRARHDKRAARFAQALVYQVHLA